MIWLFFSFLKVLYSSQIFRKTCPSFTGFMQLFLAHIYIISIEAISNCRFQYIQLIKFFFTTQFPTCAQFSVIYSRTYFRKTVIIKLRYGLENQGRFLKIRIGSLGSNSVNYNLQGLTSFSCSHLKVLIWFSQQEHFFKVIKPIIKIGKNKHHKK